MNKRNQKKAYKIFMEFHPLISAFIIFVLFFSSLQIGTTVAYFEDIESSKGNSLTAGSLDFIIDSSGSIDAYVGMEEDGGNTVIPLISPIQGSLPIEYKVKAIKVSGSDNFCSQLNINAGAPFSYSGPLLSLDTASSTSADSWTVDISLPNTTTNVNHDDLCSVDLVYLGWHDGDSGEGYIDEEKVSLTLHARMIVLNEFLPNPDGIFGNDGDSMPLGEFIEIYNNSSTTVDLTGWSVGDASTTVPITALNTFPAGVNITPHGFKAVYLNSALLDNDSDTVRLISPGAIIMDEYTYSGGAGDNKAFARIPDGIGGWVDPYPTPGYSNEALINPFDTPEEEEEDEEATTTTRMATTTTIVVTTTLKEVIDLGEENNNSNDEEKEAIVEQASITTESTATTTATTTESTSDTSTTEEATTTPEVIEESREENSTTTEEIIETESASEEVVATTEEIIEETPPVEENIVETKEEQIEEQVSQVVESLAEAINEESTEETSTPEPERTPPEESAPVETTEESVVTE